MHLRLKILTEIAISPIVIGPNGAPLQGGRVRVVGGGACHPLTFIRLGGVYSFMFPPLPLGQP